MGESGYSGYSGYVGESGVSGFSGISGFSGPAGGPSGYSGETGATGISGYSGETGATGTSGYSGETGGPKFNVSNSGASAYVINGSIDPVINLIRGFTYYFNVVSTGHPFWIKTAQVTGTGDAYNNGVSNNGTDNGIIAFNVPFDAPPTLYYICQYHISMSGTFNVSDLGASGYSGVAGTAGASGYSGVAGTAGASGYSGRSGFSGVAGTAGTAGASGHSGRSGFSGNPAVGPKSYSINYNSYNQSLMAPTSTNLILGTGNFTIEGWFYRSGLNSLDASAWLMLVDFRPSVPTTNVQLAVRGTDARVIFSVNETIRITSTSQINLSTWYHIALVRSSGVTKLYINGVQQGGNYTDTNNYSNNYCTVGSRYAPVSTDYRSWVGNISNFRVVKGTAVYNSNFTPPTDPLTAISGTSLLICNQNTISGVTATGNVLVTTSNPYGTAQLSGFSGYSGNNGLSGYSGTISSTPTFTTVNTTTLNAQNLNFTGVGPVTISSSNDIQLNATGWVTFTTLPRLPNKTLAQLNALVNVPIGAIALCTDASGGAKPVWYNGTLWRDMNNGAV